MRAANILTKLTAAGFTLTANGDAIHVRPRGRLTDELRAAIRANKPAILAELRATVAANDDHDSPDDSSVARRHTKALAMLAANPGWRMAVVVEAGDPVAVGIAVRNVAYGELEIAAANWDPKAFFDLLDQHAAAEPTKLH